jgi:DNA-binding NarL/FixJ family response regulator
VTRYRRPPKGAELTRAERRVLESFLEDAACNKVLARRLFMAPATVRVHMHAIRQKLGATNRAQVVLMVMRGRAPGPLVGFIAQQAAVGWRM